VLGDTPGTSTTFAEYDFAWDKLGQLAGFNFTSLVGDDGQADYTYDDTGQLTEADYDAGFQTNESYDYDANGKRETANSKTYATGDHNRLMEDGTYRYEYDEEGNRTLRYVDNPEYGTPDALDEYDTNITVYAWDHRNRLLSVADYATYTQYDEHPGLPDQLVQYTYDAFDQLIGRAVTVQAEGEMVCESTDVFIHQGGQIVLHYQADIPVPIADGSLAHRYLWGPGVDELLADETVDDATTDDVAWVLADHQNSVRDLVVYDDQGTTTLADDAVSVEKHTVYDAFGNVASDTAPGVSSLFLYTGRLFDEATGLQNNLHRWYDSGVGRW